MKHKRHIARKRFGQHFLTDQVILQHLVDRFAPRPDQLIVEIGPGRGALTRALLEQVPRLIAVELDRDLVNELKQHYAPNRLQVVQSDILRFDLRSCLVPGKEKQKIRLIGNLPYNISTPLIFHLLPFHDAIEDMVFMVQKEVAVRLTATPGSKNYGRLSIMTGLDLDCQTLFDVPPQAFTPPPKVHSTVIRLTPKKQRPDRVNREVLNRIVTTAFAQRRKTIRNALQPVLSEDRLTAAGIDPDKRAENLSIEQYIALSNLSR